MRYTTDRSAPQPRDHQQAPSRSPEAPQFPHKLVCTPPSPRSPSSLPRAAVRFGAVAPRPRTPSDHDYDHTPRSRSQLCSNDWDLVYLNTACDLVYFGGAQLLYELVTRIMTRTTTVMAMYCPRCVSHARPHGPMTTDKRPPIQTLLPRCTGQRSVVPTTHPPPCMWSHHSPRELLHEMVSIHRHLPARPATKRRSA